jgi:hypothetical protein
VQLSGFQVEDDMKIKMLSNQPAAASGLYAAGEVYDFPDDVAARWIAQGKAVEAVEKRWPAPKRDKAETAQTELDATSHDSSGQREILLGIRSWSGSAEYLFAGNTSSQTQLHTAIANGTKFTFEFYPAGSSATFPIYSGDGFVSGWSLSAPMDDPIVVSFEVMGTGALTQTLA